MQIAQKLAKYTLGEGDVLRRAMGKKDLEQMEQQRGKFRQGAIENGIDPDQAMMIFDKIEKFASYGFNKSHAAAYGYLSYATAYMKANYPKEWMAALMTCDSADITKVSKFIRECKAMGIKMLPPDVNEAGTTFVATAEGIRFAISGIKGVGAGVVEAIIEEREKDGPFTNFYQFFHRIDSKKVGKKVIENLVDAGCFDFTGWSRDALRQSVEPMFETAAKEQKEAEAGVMSLFSLIDDTPEKHFQKPPEVVHKTPESELLLKEKELLGFFLTGHPMDNYREILSRLSCISLRRVEGLDHQAVFRSAFIVETVKIRFSNRSQKKFAILTISDGIENYELPIWSELFDQKSAILLENQLLYAVLSVDRSEGGVRLTCHWLDDLTRANEEMIAACDTAYDRAKFQVVRQAQRKAAQKVAKSQEKKEIKQVLVKLDVHRARLSHVLEIKKIFSEHRGTTPLKLKFVVEESTLATLHIDSKWGITSDPQVKSKLQKITSILSIS